MFAALWTICASMLFASVGYSVYHYWWNKRTIYQFL